MLFFFFRNLRICLLFLLIPERERESVCVLVCYVFFFSNLCHIGVTLLYLAFYAFKLAMPLQVLNQIFSTLLAKLLIDYFLC